jgi:ubiquinone/menaquinone biosynthesis C-methylase UbiE
MRDKWAALHKQSRFRPKYPSEQVVQFVFRNFSNRGGTKILDLGCGAGRHVYFMAKENFNAYGIDISREGIEFAQGWISECGLTAELRVAPVDCIPFQNGYFDGVICYGVLYYCKFDEIIKSAEEIHRVLQTGGKSLVVVRSTNDYRYGLGREIEKNTFIIQENDSLKASYNENGMVMHFFDRKEIETIFRPFRMVTIDRLDETHDNERYYDSNYLVSLEK